MPIALPSFFQTYANYDDKLSEYIPEFPFFKNLYM